jgi:hypothetical protein
LVVHAVDGTKIMAASGRRSMWHREDLEKLAARLDESLDEVMAQVEMAQDWEPGEYRRPEEFHDQLARRARIQEALQVLAAADRDHLHAGEPEARLMKVGQGTELSYNAQAVADGASGLVVAADVVNDELDAHQLTPMLDQVQENLGATAQETLADAGYVSGARIALAEARGL